MSINQISNANTFGQLVTAVSAVIAVANNLTDGPEVHSNSTWTFSNPDVGINVGNTALITTANVGTLNAGVANIVTEVVGTSTIDTAGITVANIDGATITNLITTEHLTTNQNVDGLLQVSDRANIFSANIETANIGALALNTLAVDELTVPVLNASFANITTLSVTGTSQHIAIVAVLVTTDNCNVRILNASSVNISNSFISTLNASSANITSLTVGTQNISSANITTLTVPNFNTSQANITNETVGRSNISTANITNLFANVANIISGNITVVNIASGVILVTANPTANLQVATKNYVDTGAGANLVNKLTFNAKGDIIVGTGANTFAAMNSGSNGQLVIVDSNQSNNLRYASRATQITRGLVMGTSLADKSANGTQLIVYKLEEAIMDDGEVVTGWTLPATIDISSNGGAGFLDTGVSLANTWYEVYAIRKRSDGTKNFLLHRALDRKPDQNTMNGLLWTTTAGAGLGLGANSTIAGANQRLAQSFTPNVSGPLTSIEVRAFKSGATANGNIWLTLETNTAGVPAGTTLATSRKMDISRLAITNASNLRFVFDTTANVVAGTSYFWVYNADNQGNTTLFTNLVYSLANTDLAANGVNRGVPKGNSGASWADLTPGIGTFLYKTYVEANSTAVTMPAGYDQKCLISYASTDANNRLKEYHQTGRTIQTYFSTQWSGTVIWQIQNPEVVDLLNVVPPISCMVSFIMFTPAGSPQSMSIGRFHALDVATTIAEALPGIAYCTASGGTTITPTLPFVVEQQAIVVRVQTSLTKPYPCTITF